MKLPDGEDWGDSAWGAPYWGCQDGGQQAHHQEATAPQEGHDKVPSHLVYTLSQTSYGFSHEKNINLDQYKEKYT